MIEGRIPGAPARCRGLVSRRGDVRRNGVRYLNWAEFVGTQDAVDRIVERPYRNSFSRLEGPNSPDMFEAIVVPLYRVANVVRDPVSNELDARLISYSRWRAEVG
ncbi:MAG: hypothetical protein ABS79_00265 [Planctomycetes bacterium SCN 63-9]|nr:MAG: hypothetical protein ABS79_00265 [Planctomycetes bacterium SCN 63-9]